ncbi:hypothetical protein Hte_002366 [Hypoxylon texense]
MPTLLEHLWNGWHPPADPTHLSFRGKTVLVARANSGLGFHAAIKYAQLGASRLILGVRSQEKGEAAKASILSQTKSSAEIIIITVDLSTFASMTQFARRVDRQVDNLHIALLCAGVLEPTFKLGQLH